MKKLPYYLLIFMSCIAISCSKENVDQVTPPDTEGEVPVIDPIADTPPNVVTTPCDFDLSTVDPNSTIIFNCVLDLKGETITLPANVKFEFDGGDVKNGKLIFAGGTIAGELLSSELEIEGDVQLKEPTFKFFASRWKGIVEGTTTSDIAQENTFELERLFEYTKGYGAKTFQIGKFDAFFQIHNPTPPYSTVHHKGIEAVNVPSDFNLVMSDNTNLRVFPGTAEHERGALLAVRDAENITISGGVLYGDRDLRAYPPGELAGQYGSHTLLIRSGRNVTIDGVRFVDGSSGSLNINSIGFSFNPDTYNPTTNVTVQNCKFENSRRMSIALTEGRDIKILNNTFTNTGNPSTNSDGGEVGYGINIEPTRRRDPDTGELKEFERVFDVLIKGNTETGSRGGCVSITIGQTVTVEDNNFETQLVFTHTNGTRIINNTFKALSPEAKERFAIFAADGGETAFNNIISGNTISGYDLGIATNADDTDITNNTITDCAIGLQIGKSKNSEFNDNTITTTGNAISATNSFVQNISLKRNTVNGGRFHVYFAQLNNKPEYADYRVTLENNTFITSKAISFSKANGVIFKNNKVDGGLQIGDASNIEVSGNTKISPTESDGIRLFGDNSSVTLLNNTIFEPTGAARFVCINNNSTNPGAVTDTGNTCN
ncbi:right-handed parallel beta-helix repeat-containing protein [Aquimarina sp. AU58]|uniref:right-handed parallel beta-helix repeat-containing protein n=1 Tax=Aquimarina sp. AU58 TaxID=1874112 RepID=UPI000D6E6A7D|nr:right-handed parallel beta-helix repeat-containing protein [Aquimarina sp. AU58]